MITGTERQERFQTLADFIRNRLTGSEHFLLNFSAEDSDFVRYNHGEVRQAGSVAQCAISLDLIRGQRHASANLTLTGDDELDQERVKQLLLQLRDRLRVLPEDPFLLFSTENASSEHHQNDSTPAADRAFEEIHSAGRHSDLVGVYASGGLHRGFANYFGQHNWHSTYNFNFDWSSYFRADKAVQKSYAGFAWNSEAFQRKIQQAAVELEVLKRPPETIKPGKYRVFLSPSAVNEILGLLRFGGFSLKAQRTKQTPLLRMLEDRATLNEAIALSENTQKGVAPNFQEAGFLRPPCVPLIESGLLCQSLVSPRSAREFDIPTNGATAMEAPLSLDLKAGTLAEGDVLTALDDGIYVSQLFYLNYSDKVGCRATGMTRFATFLVKGGAIQAPLNVMRFDETVYRMFGANLVALTADREFHLDPKSYFGRSVASSRLPGALVEDFMFTL